MRWLFDERDEQDDKDWYKCSNCWHLDWWETPINPNLNTYPCDNCGEFPDEVFDDLS